MDRQARLTQAGHWLRREREQRRFSVRQLATRIDVTTQVIYDWQNGKNAVSDDRAEKIAEVFGMDVVEVRRNLGLWVPEQDARQVDVDAELARALAEIRASREEFDQRMERVEDLLAGHAERTGQGSEHTAREDGQEETKRRRGA